MDTIHKHINSDMYAYVGTGACSHVSFGRGQKKMMGVLLYHSLADSSEAGSLTENLELAGSQQALAIPRPVSLHSNGATGAQPCSDYFI